MRGPFWISLVTLLVPVHGFGAADQMPFALSPCSSSRLVLITIDHGVTLLDGPCWRGSSPACDHCSESIGERCNTLRQPAAVKSVQQARGESIPGSDCVYYVDGVASERLKNVVRVECAPGTAHCYADLLSSKCF